jgi:uncharacterized membrane protein YbhN (UPF0104 family)
MRQRGSGSREGMERLRESPLLATALAFAIAALAVVAIAAAYGFGAFAQAWSNLDPGWLPITICAALVAPGAYLVAYRAVAGAQDGPELPIGLAARIVAAGFGPFAIGGGFALDKRALRATHGRGGRAATVRVLGLGALEWSLLAPAAWISAVALLVDGSPAMRSLLWPWALLVPLGFAMGLRLAAPERRERIGEGGGPWRETLHIALTGVGILRLLARNLPAYWSAWLAGAMYWVLEVGAFYGALRFIGLHPSGWQTVLAYATGYALTRRSLPLGGAGATETLMTFALHWVGFAVPPALAAVVVYRVGNFILPTAPALLALPRVKPLVDAGEEGQVAREAAAA